MELCQPSTKTIVVSLIAFFALIGVLVSAAGTYVVYRFRTCNFEKHERLLDISGYDFEIEETSCTLTVLPGSLIGITIYRHGDQNGTTVTSYFPQRGDPLPSFSVSNDQIIVSAPRSLDDYSLNYFDGKMLEYHVRPPNPIAAK